jgi:hypothetical protein
VRLLFILFYFIFICVLQLFWHRFSVFFSICSSVLPRSASQQLTKPSRWSHDFCIPHPLNSRSCRDCAQALVAGAAAPDGDDANGLVPAVAWLARRFLTETESDPPRYREGAAIAGVLSAVARRVTDDGERETVRRWVKKIAREWPQANEPGASERKTT